MFLFRHIKNQDVWDYKAYKKQLQSGIDLGKRMQNAFVYAFTQGFGKVVFLDTNCIESNPAIIMNSFVYLNNFDIVTGSAKNRGYCLLGMKKLHAQLFQNISWSTKEVLNQTMAICESLKLSLHLLPELSDIDDEDDFKKVQNKLLLIKEGEV